MPPNRSNCIGHAAVMNRQVDFDVAPAHGVENLRQTLAQTP
jgi:hypothetical protein